MMDILRRNKSVATAIRILMDRLDQAADDFDYLVEQSETEIARNAEFVTLKEQFIEALGASKVALEPVAREAERVERAFLASALRSLTDKTDAIRSRL